MIEAEKFRIAPGLAVLLNDTGVDAANVLRRAGLPSDLFARGPVTLEPEKYFALWGAMEDESNDPLLPIHLGMSISIEAFDPLIFAVLCSKDLNTAVERVALYKKLVGPIRLAVTRGPKSTSIEFQWPKAAPPPPSLATAELIFILGLARMATRSSMSPIRITSPFPPQPASAYFDYLGVAFTRGTKYSITFAKNDASLPFLTVNEPMWDIFEPQLRTRLALLDGQASMVERVRAVLIESLPTGDSSIQGVARELTISTRTLQRILRSENTNFQEVLHQTRSSLARHYLDEGVLSTSEIAFLLGYEDPRSFYRAFSSWTGLTPQSARELAG